MSVFDSWMYADPEKVAIRREEEAIRKAKACGDCIHKRTAEFRGEVGHYCSFKRHVYGRDAIFLKSRKEPDAKHRCYTGRN